MSEGYSNEQILEIFIFETTQLIDQMEQLLLNSEKGDGYTHDTVNEIFRIMHTIKGSAALMQYNNVSKLAHSIEDIFYFIRERENLQFDYSQLSDIVFEFIDFVKIELEKIKNSDNVDGDSSSLIENTKQFLILIKQENNPEADANAQKQENTTKTKENLKSTLFKEEVVDAVSAYTNFFKATMFFDDDCDMENIRAFSIINKLEDFTDEIHFSPIDILDNEETCETIKKEGFKIFVNSNKSFEEMNDFLHKTVFLKNMELIELEDNSEFKNFSLAIKKNIISNQENKIKNNESNTPIAKQNENNKHPGKETQANMISVNVNKLDKLMDLVGELVISEEMVAQNPDLADMELENFRKATRQLHKITTELQDIVMSIRMVPLASTFMKMNRVTRDMSKKLNKKVQLEILGEDTEVDKSIIEHISDPLMHLIRNSVDHGVESDEERLANGKTEPGKVTLEGRNASSEVLILVKDNGKGLDKTKILKKAKENGILTKPESEMTDREIYNLIFLPGFSTKEAVSEFSGRGVGMDVVAKNLASVNGTILVDSIQGQGTVITLKIPLTLAIIGGMNIRVGSSRYTIPTTSIKESFRASDEDIITDPDGNEMIMVRGECYPLVKLHNLYNVRTDITKISDGIILMAEHETKNICLFADELLGGQQVVVKSLPGYIKKVPGVAGCTLLGDGSISLILDIAGLITLQMEP